MSSRVQLLELDVDCLAHIVSLVPTDDLLPVALTCKQLAAAHDHALAIDGCTFEWTTSATKTFSRLKWAVDVMHAARHPPGTSPRWQTASFSSCGGCNMWI